MDSAAPRPPPDAAQPAPAPEPIYLNRDFRVLWLARTLGQTAANTAQFGSLIIIAEATGSGLRASLLILSWILPAVVMGLVAGVVIDALPKRWVLLTANGLRAAAAIAFVLSGQGVGEVYAVVVALAMLGPFVGPAESALVPTLVGKEDLTSANAFLNLMRYVAQIAGLVVLAPLLTKVAAPDVLFLVTGVLFASAAVYAAVIPARLRTAPLRFPDEASRWGRRAFLEALQFLKRERTVFRATVHLALLAATIPLLAALMPVYLTEVLGQEVSDLPVVLLPAVIGMLLGLRLVSTFARRRGASRLGTIGLAGFIAGLLLLAFIDAVAATLGSVLGLRDVGLGPLPNVTAESQVVMVIALPMGFAFSLVSVAANAVLNQRVPLPMQGRIFSVQSLMASLASIPPLLAGGAMAAVVDVRIVLGLVPVLLAYTWMYAQWGTADPRDLMRWRATGARPT